MTHSWRLLTIVGIAAALTACHGRNNSPSPTAPSPPPTAPSDTLPVAVASVVPATEEPIAAVTSVQFDGSRSRSNAPGGITQYLWDFGDGAQASGPLVQHVFNASGTKTVTLTVTDANGTSAPASTSVTIKSLGGDGLPPAGPCPDPAYEDFSFAESDKWHAQFRGHTRTYSLKQFGSVLCGRYTDTAFPSLFSWVVRGSVDSSRRLAITAKRHPEETTVIATIDATVSSFTGTTYGGSADGQTLSYYRGGGGGMPPSTINSPHPPHGLSDRQEEPGRSP